VPLASETAVSLAPGSGAWWQNSTTDIQPKAAAAAPSVEWIRSPPREVPVAADIARSVSAGKVAWWEGCGLRVEPSTPVADYFGQMPGKVAWWENSTSIIVPKTWREPEAPKMPPSPPRAVPLVADTEVLLAPGSGAWWQNSTSIQPKANSTSIQPKAAAAGPTVEWIRSPPTVVPVAAEIIRSVSAGKVAWWEGEGASGSVKRALSQRRFFDRGGTAPETVPPGVVSNPNLIVRLHKFGVRVPVKLVVGAVHRHR
jgi:hypothetical protein